MYNLKALSVVIAICSLSIQAQASNINVALTGTANQGTTGSFVSGNTQWDYTFWSLSSTDFPIMVNNGDTITATINFDQNITVPSSLGGSSFLFAITGAAMSQTPYNTATSGTTQLIEMPGNTTIFSNGLIPSTTSGQFSNVASLDPTQSYSFNQVIETLTITDTSGNSGINLDQAQVYYMNSSPAPVPLPPAVIMFASGLIGLGAIGKKRVKI